MSHDQELRNIGYMMYGGLTIVVVGGVMFSHNIHGSFAFPFMIWIVTTIMILCSRLLK